MNRSDYLKKIVEDKDIQQCMTKHQLNVNEVEKSFSILLSYIVHKNKCLKCKGLMDCQQANIGYMPVVDFNGVNFDVEYLPCKYKEIVLEQENMNRNLICYSCNFDNFNFNDIYINEKRKEVLAKIKGCINDYRNHLPTKGLFLHGQYGCGKTYLLAYLAKNLAQHHHQVLFTYYPDLVRKIKSSIGNGTLEEMIDMMKDAEVLVLDDFGGEMLTGFIRDEVLGVVLQDRMSNNRLTFMSSNLTPPLLFEHLKESTKDIDALRASRIYERIRTLMEFVELNDQNYRF